MKRHYKWGFLGGGKMAEGILAAALDGAVKPRDVIVAERLPARARTLAETYGVTVTGEATVAAASADRLVLAVRPQDVAALADAVRPCLSPDTLLVSIAAGKSIATLRRAFGRAVRIVRVMPNLALRVREGMCAVCPARNATDEDVACVREILDGAGRTLRLAERHFDAVTALSGSGPAFYAHMVRAMAAGGRRLGLPREAARLLAEQTLFGTAAFLRKTGMDLDAFVGGVATPGGTTAAGMGVLTGGAFEAAVAETLAAAARRSEELGK